MDESRRIAAAEEVPEDGSLLVTVRSGFDEAEVVLVRSNGTIRAWRNYCPHWTDVDLDRGSGATVRNGRIVCRKHGATFEKDSGHCDHGPCAGASLEPVDVAVEGGDVYLTDEEYAFVRRGGTEPDVDELSSRGRIGFE